MIIMSIFFPVRSSLKFKPSLKVVNRAVQVSNNIIYLVSCKLLTRIRNDTISTTNSLRSNNTPTSDRFYE